MCALACASQEATLDASVLDGEPQLLQDLIEENEATETFDTASIRKSFSKLRFQNPELKESAETVMMSAEEETGGGMALLYKKLQEVIDETNEEAGSDLIEMTRTRGQCARNLADANKAITVATETQSQNDMTIKAHAIGIGQNSDHFTASKQTVLSIHKEFLQIPIDRQALREPALARIDERNKGLDVMKQATFIVCVKFKRFQNTAQCIRIKAMPDVDEPPVSEQGDPSVKATANDKIETGFFEKSKRRKWKKIFRKDEELEGDPNPEGLPLPPEAGQEMKGQTGLVDETEDAPTLKEAVSDGEEEEDMLADRPLGEDEEIEVETLKKLTKGVNNAKYTAPLDSLVVALQEGETKKAMNLVQVLLDVMKAIHDEQMADKKALEDSLNHFYMQAWMLQAQLEREKQLQDRLAADTETRRLSIHDLMGDTEHQRTTIIEQKEVKLSEEDRCAKLEEEYGIRGSIRVEDLENISKLRSLLRSLYNKRNPVSCKHGPFAPRQDMCSSQEHGWCIYENKDGDAERCSCNAGFFGATCEYTMCAGAGQMLYTPDQEEGVCSGHGRCNKMNGKCHMCSEGYHHGPKEACDYKHCPNVDMDGKHHDPDDQCSGHGSCDQKRGLCNCENEWSGVSCQHKKCLATNTVLYPFQSGNACDGHGACDKATGECACPAPFSGKTCNKKACPANCMGRGACDVTTGKCACMDPYFGPQCEYQSCPFDCRDGGWCDLLEGKCLCKYGYGGESCRKTASCPSVPVEDTTRRRRRKKKRHDPVLPGEANWYTLWDKPGWALCPHGEAVSGLYRSKCEALACLNSAKCGGVCLEGKGENIEARHCYHAMSWYDSFDQAGWSACESNYYISGFYRSCESLYCLQMAKCCSFKDSRWAQCEDLNWSEEWKDAEAWVEAPAGKFLTALYRTDSHKLRSLENARACTFAYKY